MSEEQQNEVAQEATPEQAAPDPEADAQQNATAETQSAEPKTLLSDDGGNGEGAAVVPEKYEFAAPEGYEVTPDVQSKLDEFSGIAKDTKLSQEQYQSLVQWQVEKGIAMSEDASSAYEQRVQDWAEQAKTDEEMGGESFSENLSVANQAVEQFSTAGLKSILARPSAQNPNGLGIGNHPEVVRLFYRIGKAMGDSNLIAGGAAENQGDPLQRMYPTMYSDKP